MTARQSVDPLDLNCLAASRLYGGSWNAAAKGPQSCRRKFAMQLHFNLPHRHPIEGNLSSLVTSSGRTSHRQNRQWIDESRERIGLELRGAGNAGERAHRL